MSTVGDLLQLIEHDIPEGRRHLQDSHTNLERVAAYCEGNYLQAPEKRHALEETKNYTTQSLASVAYQINTLATNFLHLLDLQNAQMAEMESSINHLSQTVMIHKEKVARREIGVLTTNKTTTRPQGVKNPGIVFPDQPERPIKYVRKRIDYSSLDDIGHGVKAQNPRNRRTSSGGTVGKQGAPGASQAPTTKPPTPPSTVRGTGTLTRQTSSPYRTPAPPVSPPSVPSHYAPGYGMQQQMERRQGYAPGSHAQVAHVQPSPSVRMVQPMSKSGPPPHSVPQPIMTQAPSSNIVSSSTPPPPTPPPPPMPEQPPPHQHQPGSRESYEPPPPPLPESAYQASHMGNMFGGQLPRSANAFNQHGMPRPGTAFGSHVLRQTAGRGQGNVSPPLPPPPDQGDPAYGDNFSPPPPPHFVSRPQERPTHDGEGYDINHYHGGHNAPLHNMDNADWVPKNYIEKVLAIYDYVKDKEDELTFSEGAVIYVIKKNDDGWWEGVMDGITGLFPGNYVEHCM